MLGRPGLFMKKLLRKYFRKLTSARNKERSRKICEIFLPFIKKGSRVLDLGTGSARNARFIKNNKKVDITLLDITDEYNQTDLKVKVYDGGRVPFRKNYFDVVLLIYVLHHSDSPDLTLREAVRVSKDKVLILEDVANNRLQYWVTVFWDTLGNLIWKVDWLPDFKSEKYWENSFKKLGLKLIEKGVFKKRPARRVYYILRK